MHTAFRGDETSAEALRQPLAASILYTAMYFMTRNQIMREWYGFFIYSVTYDKSRISCWGPFLFVLVFRALQCVQQKPQRQERP